MKFSPAVIKRVASEAVPWTDSNMVASMRFGPPILNHKDGKTVIVGTAFSGGKPSTASNPGTNLHAAVKTGNSYAALAVDSSTDEDNASKDSGSIPANGALGTVVMSPETGGSHTIASPMDDLTVTLQFVIHAAEARVQMIILPGAVHVPPPGR